MNGSISIDATDEVRRLGMGRLLSDISTKMQRKVAKGDADPMRILVHSTHDTTLAAICASLDVFDERLVSACNLPNPMLIADHLDGPPSPRTSPSSFSVSTTPKVFPTLRPGKPSCPHLGSRTCPTTVRYARLPNLR